MQIHTFTVYSATSIPKRVEHFLGDDKTLTGLSHTYNSRTDQYDVIIIYRDN